MEPIRSGTTTERILRAIALATLINSFATAFLWDGYVGYPRENATQLARLLGISDEALPPIDPALSAGVARKLMQEIPHRGDRRDVQSILGTPALEHGGHTYYVGPGGRISVQWDGDRVAGVEWVGGIHSETDLVLQRWFGYVLGIIGACYLLHFIRVLTFRASLTSAGLKVHGKPLIPFDAMKGLRRRDDGRSQRFELEYESGEREESLVLDDYIIKRTPEIVAAICSQRGFADPLNPDASDSDNTSAS